MLIRTKTLSSTEYEQAYNQVKAELDNPEVLQRFGLGTTPETLLNDESMTPNQEVQFYTIGYISYNNGIHGTMQAFISIDENQVISCLDVVILKTNSMYRFGKDLIVFYEKLQQMCHRIRTTSMIPTDVEAGERGAVKWEMKHIPSAKQISKRLYAVQDGLGRYQHQLQWEAITDKGLAYYKHINKEQ
ncbi:hypothetical protein [Vibrio fortis]|uniref:hypothetical protein n=1 Tax=Vibrio fortis TaxID=212667 RepID=UPI0038CDA333